MGAEHSVANSTQKPSKTMKADLKKAATIRPKTVFLYGALATSNELRALRRGELVTASN